MSTTIIASDLHLGSRNSRTDSIAQLLRSPFDRLILNGDTVQNLNFKKFKPRHWRIIGQLREVAQKRELILIRGNHDGKALDGHVFGPLDVLATLLGVPLHEEYRIELGGRKYVILHGDRFDPTLHWPILSDAADWCYQATQKVNKSAAKWLKKQVKHLGGVVAFLKHKAVVYAQSQGCDGVITGHTHFCDEDWVGDIHFLNTGCWVDLQCTYVLARHNSVQLRVWNETHPVDHSMSAESVLAS